MVNITTPLLIIAAALPRSGTASIKIALERIGHKVFHALEWNDEYRAIWYDLVQADAVTHNATRRTECMDAFVELLSRDGFTATLDQPSCFVYQDLMEYYPNAKVLMTQRNASNWARSMVEMSHSLDVILYQPPFDSHPDKIKNPFGNWSKAKQGIRREEVHVHGIQDSDNPLERHASVSLKTCERAYHEYQTKVQQTVPPEKLVPFSVKDGWEPLCAHFLLPDRTCPREEPFPRVNTADTSFLLAFRRQAKIRTILYRIHPWLSGKTIGNLIYWMRYQWSWTTISVALATMVLFVN